MKKTDLYKVFSNPFNLEDWKKVLKEVFGAKRIFSEPKEIPLANTKLATKAYELGSFTTTDDRIVGLYRVEVSPNVWLERNKVGLRKLLRNVYKYDVDGAIIVFDQGDKWRLSFVSEIKILDEEGRIVEDITEPKRYTYLLGKDEKVKTPADQLSKLIGKPLALIDIKNAFSVETLNKEFYQIIAEYFYKLVGGKIKTKGKKPDDYGEGLLKLPGVGKDDNKIRKEFAVRLIGRIIFCWFLKVKKSGNGVPLLPENLLSSEAVKKNPLYYHHILEPLFFQTLNTPIDKRIYEFSREYELVPFLNGGLFEPHNEDYYNPNPATGISYSIGTLQIPDKWFKNFFTELEKYNFTIDENSPVEVEISIDPEMLGRILENLLAEINPETGETARKATGSYYTPREIVGYMVIESLTQYIHNQTNIKTERLRALFKLIEKPVDFTDEEKLKILESLDKVKVLDPACGSGAFLIGTLHKIMIALQKLDPEAEWWKKKQLEKIDNPAVRQELKDKLDNSTVEYAQKIGIIKNSLYGVDIQHIATEIAKLRVFLTLIVDEKIEDEKPNRGIFSLPNLEFKFVTANTLIKLPEATLFDKVSLELIKKLEEYRNDYFQSYGKEKEKIKQSFLATQKKIVNSQEIALNKENIKKGSRAYKLSTWNPFNNEPAGWFDPEWMFGVKGFDIVIGNPPYIDSEKMVNTGKKYLRDYIQQNYKLTKGNWDIYIAFYERAFDLAEKKGVITYITPDKWLAKNFGEKFREFSLIYLQSLLKSGREVFETALVDSIVTVFITGIKLNEFYFYEYEKNNFVLKRIVNKKIIKKPYQLDLVFSKYLDFIFKISNNHRKLVSTYNVICENACATSDAYKLKNFIIDCKDDNKNFYKLINTGTIDKYASKWGVKEITYLGNKFLFPSVSKDDFHRHFKNSYGEKAKKSKLIIKGLNLLECSIDIFSEYIPGKTTLIVSNLKENNGTLLKFVSCLINSKIAFFYIKERYSASSYNKGITFSKAMINDLPVPSLALERQKPFEILVDYILLLKSKREKINELVPNRHIAQIFEEVIDAMVMELYFEKEFHEKDLYFIKYAERDFEPIENLKTDEEKIAVINETYQKLKNPNHEIMKNLQLMEKRLPDIVIPIKNVRKH